MIMTMKGRNKNPHVYYDSIYGIYHDSKVTKISIPNDKCFPEMDTWLKKNIGFGNWIEWIGLSNRPYRSFSFTHEKDMVLFKLRWQ